MLKVALMSALCVFFFPKGNLECLMEKDEYSGKYVYSTSEIPPKFGSRSSDLVKYIGERFHPDDYTPIQASFLLKFIVDSSGFVRFVRINGKVGKDLTEGEKALAKIATLMPLWTPGQCKGKRIDCIVSIPILY